ncbi:MAG: bifunctional phosphoribosyl-AMP cyclohydrolase/phosphoribosyl-ATP diphosphatase HisIE, partial [Lachnospiraceae bacterium]|nr:bifunctional phosphoribosyl-AMP cyclohydrolase/phosphoribosyl-ATP diphosphatase HisIE [Lachnospiraceae bacterium]
TMPSRDVTVSSASTPPTPPSTPVMTRDITLNVSGLGKVEASSEHAAPGTTITITAEPNSGFYLGSMRVTTTAGLSVKLTKVDETTFQFVLPTSNVTVYVSFWSVNSNSDTPIMPGTNVNPNIPTNPSTPTMPTDPFPTLPNSPFDGVNAYQLPFRDMGMTSWFYQDVLYLYQRNIIRGISANAFGPTQTTTRGEVATMLYRLAGEPAVNGTSSFKDVPPLPYYTNAVTWAASKGYVTGYDANTFGPGDKISREQLVTILYRYVVANNVGVDISNTSTFRSFGDASAVSGYAINENAKELLAIKTLCQNNDITVNTFDPAIPWEEFKLNSDGHVTVVVQDYKTDEVLMVAYMNEEAYNTTLRTGKMTYYSRSRQELWVKGETSGHFQYVKSLTADCDKDTILARVSQIGAACHTGSRSCFFNEIMAKDYEETNPLKVFEQVFDVIRDRKIHPKDGSYTNYLFDKGIDKILKKLGEEATEIVIAAKNPNANEIKYEISDFLYHMMVLMAEKNITWEEITAELAQR